MRLNGLLVDFETRSTCDLKACGAYVYATDPTTEVICCAFMDPDQGVMWTWRNPKLWPGHVNVWPEWVLDHIESRASIIYAHNAQFDRWIWEFVAENDCEFPPIDLADHRWYCTSAQARVNALPGGLDDATRALTGEKKKDFRGARLISECSVPPYVEDERTLEEMVKYCEQDLRALAILLERCRPLTVAEHEEWRVNEAINNRGVRVDMELAALAVQYAEAEAKAIAERLTEITSGAITKHTQTQRIRNFVLARVRSPESLAQTRTVEQVMTRWKNGKQKFSIDKAARAELLGRREQLDLPPDVCEVLELTDDGNRSSVSKFAKMLSMADPEDERIRGAFVYAGASQTLRYASRGLQLHNMRRDCWLVGEAGAVKHRMHNMEPDPSPEGYDTGIMDTLSRLLRPTLIPADGHQFVIGDWSAIEAMGLPYLAGGETAGRILELFRDGEDLYVYTANQLGIDDRQIGKVATLSLGYGGAVGAFMAMARNYGVFLDEHRVKMIVDRWRQANMWAVAFWRELWNAAVRAVRHPNEPQHANDKISYFYEPRWMGGTLMCIFPGTGPHGHSVLQYPFARVKRVDGRTELSAIKAAWTPAADAKEWPRVTLWHGMLAENVTQAFCAAILRHALRRLETEEGPGDVVMHVHDEIVLEVPRADAYAAQDRLMNVMALPPAFAAGLPLRAEPIIANRYGKG